MVAGLLGNESSDSNRFTLVTPKSENDVRLQATLGNQNPTGLPVGVVREDKQILLDNINKVHTTEMGINRIIKNLKLNAKFMKNVATRSLNLT